MAEEKCFAQDYVVLDRRKENTNFKWLLNIRFLPISLNQ